MNFDDFEEQAASIIAAAGAIPDRAVGAHLSADRVSQLAQGALDAPDEQAALAHLDSCASCAERAEAAFHELEMTRLRLAVWLQAVAVAVSAARALRRRSLATRRIEAPAIEWRATDDPALSCAVYRDDGWVFAVSSSSKAWLECPLRCVLRDEASGVVWAEAWMILPGGSASEDSPATAAVPLVEGRPRPEAWTARIERCALTAGSTPAREDVEGLRKAVAVSDETARAAWVRWLDAELAPGRVTGVLRDAILSGS